MQDERADIVGTKPARPRLLSFEPGSPQRLAAWGCQRLPLRHSGRQAQALVHFSKRLASGLHALHQQVHGLLGHLFHRPQYARFVRITGGAIGIGLPLALGAAVAAPQRKVIGLQADGSAMYTLPALWTQARERLDVVTIIFSNRRYAILHGEYGQVGAGAPGANAQRLFDIVDPALDWVQLAHGMGVGAERADTAERFNALLASAVKQPGPFLIEAVI